MIELCVRHTDKVEKIVRINGKRFKCVRCEVCRTAKMVEETRLLKVT